MMLADRSKRLDTNYRCGHLQEEGFVVVYVVDLKLFENTGEIKVSVITLLA